MTVYGHTTSRTLTQLAGVALDANTGEVLRVVEPRTFTPGTTFLRGLTSLHFGDFSHLAVKWLYFILGMAGAFLFYSGNLLWIEARRTRRGVVQTRNSRIMAQLTVGVSLGCIAGIAAACVASRILPVDLAQRAEQVELAYFALFFGSIVWTLLRPPIRGAYEMLLVCAVLTFAIPVANGIVTGVFPLNSIATGDGIMIAVVSFVFAAVFWSMSRALRKRAMSGDPNSVWPAPRASAVTVQVEAEQR